MSADLYQVCLAECVWWNMECRAGCVSRLNAWWLCHNWGENMQVPKQNVKKVKMPIQQQNPKLIQFLIIWDPYWLVNIEESAVHDGV